MNNFKVGDDIQCINDIDTIFLTKGMTYTIGEIVEDRVRLIGLGSLYDYDRFKKPNKGVI